jgi:hypothetical protein
MIMIMFRSKLQSCVHAPPGFCIVALHAQHAHSHECSVRITVRDMVVCICDWLHTMQHTHTSRNYLHTASHTATHTHTHN